MGLKVALGSARGQSSSASQLLNGAKQTMLQLQEAVTSYTQDTSRLKGQAFEASRAYQTEVIAPAIELSIQYYAAVQQVVTRLPEAYVEMVDSKSWSEDELQRLIDNERRSQLLLQEQSLALSVLKGIDREVKTQMMSSLNRSMALHEDNLAKYQEILERLRAFDGYSASLFSEAEALRGLLEQALSMVKGTWESQTNRYHPQGDKVSMMLQTVQKLTNKQFAEEYGVRRPAGMSDEDYQLYLNELRQQVSDLKSDGWSQKAIKEGYIATVNVAYDSKREMTIGAQLGEYFDNAHTVGSGLFNKMVTVAYKDTKEGQQKTLDMIYKVLGAKVDDNGFLQMTNMKITESDKQGSYKFTTNMDDALAFDDTFSGIVQDAYPKGLPTKLKEGSKDFTRAQETHQFRYYMDLKNNQALRATYPNEKNDLERIKRYNEDNPSSKFTGEKARLHNKYQGDPEDYPKHIEQYGENSKYVSSGDGFHSEFIVDKDGNLVSQWNAYEIDENGNVNSDPNKAYTKEEQMQLVDGNSVNYAESSGRGDYHTEYDSDPVSKYDPEVRKNVGKKWKSPGTRSSKEDYFDRDESKKRANELLKG